MNRRVKLK